MNEDRYRELDRVQAELQIMSCLVSYPIDMQDQLVTYAEDIAALLRSEGVWATHSDWGSPPMKGALL